MGYSTGAGIAVCAAVAPKSAPAGRSVPRGGWRGLTVNEAFGEQLFRGADGTQFAYLEAGTGPPIVLLHGWSSSLRWWNRNISALAAGHRVLALDFRGHGSSEKTPSGHTMESYARDLQGFVQQFEADGALMVGWSMGSIVLWDYVMQFGAGQARAMVFVGQSASDLTTARHPHGVMDERACISGCSISRAIDDRWSPTT